KSTCRDASCCTAKLTHGCRHWSTVPQSPSIEGEHTWPAVDPEGPAGHVADWQNASAPRAPSSVRAAAAKAGARRIGCVQRKAPDGAARKRQERLGGEVDGTTKLAREHRREGRTELVAVLRGDPALVFGVVVEVPGAPLGGHPDLLRRPVAVHHV